MGLFVTAAEAAALVRRHERIVRGRIKQGDLPSARKNERGAWQIDTDDLARIWTLDPERLAALEQRQRRAPAALLARVETLEAALRIEQDMRRSLERRLRALEASPGGQQASHGYGDIGAALAPSDLLLSASSDELADWPTVSRAAGRVPTVALADRGPGVAPMFRTRTDAARWLERHGVKASTARHWDHWQTVGLTPAEVFAFALERLRDARAHGDVRVSWRLQRCDDPACVCAEVLA